MEKSRIMLGLRVPAAGRVLRFCPTRVAFGAIALALPLLLLAGSLHAAGTVFSTTIGGSGQDFATSVTSDSQGNTYVAGLTYSPDFPVTAGAAQTKFGGTCDAFIAKIGPDGKLIWSTYLGGILDDWATGIALDAGGNVLVAGYSRSGNFPLVHAIKNTLNGVNGDDYDAFVAKFDPNGTRLIYSTFLGGNGDDGAAGIASDAAGDAYVAVSVQSAAGFPGTNNAPNQFGIVVSKLDPQGSLIYSFVHPSGSAAAIAVDAAGSAYVAGTVSSVNPSPATKTFGPAGAAQAMVFKLSADGGQKLFETRLGGSVRADATAIAVAATGEIYVAGGTSSVDFPLVRPLQTSPGARPLWKSVDGGVTWTPFDDLPFALPQVLAPDPSNPNTLYLATGDSGVFKSLDGGATWNGSNHGITGSNVQSLVIDPVHPQTLYAVTPSAGGSSPSAVYKSVDGAANWTLIDSPVLAPQLAVDAQNPNIVWGFNSTIRKSTDAGATWSPVTFPGTVQTLVLDPGASGHVFAISNMVFCGFFCGNNQPPYLYRSIDGGANWIQNSGPVGPGTPLLVDASTKPSTVYQGLISRSDDGGVTWVPIAPPPGGTSPMPLAVDTAGTLYAAVSGGLIYVSRDHAQTWAAVGSPVPPWTNRGAGVSVANIIPAGAGGALYAILNQVATSGFVTRLSADGSTILYSTYLRGHPSGGAFLEFLAEPTALFEQNWISGIALDPADNATVAGITRASDFPVAAPAQSANAGLADAFAATIAADGSKLTFSTYLGGSQDDGALAVGLDAKGSVILAGQTWSPDFPFSEQLQQNYGFGEAFLTKLAPPGPPSITAVLNGASFQPGIEAGSWVAIKGTNLANTSPGRIWRTDEVIGGRMPTSLDGVSVTIDGKPAFVYYISQSQINVQAPSDTALGPVDVVVNNNGSVSAPATAQLQSAAPAFFTYYGTDYAIASRLPDYAPVADPSVVPSTVAAHPGDTLTLWGTGFGPTNPPAPAGTAVTGNPVVVTMPQVSVGGVPVTVIGASLTPDSAGLYQVTVQLPSTVPTGAVAVEASAAGVTTQSSALLFIARP